MDDTQKEICLKAIKILRATEHDNPFRKIRLEYADQIELQVLVGNPEHDLACVSLSQDIIGATESPRPALAADVSNLHAAHVRAIGYEYVDLDDLLGQLRDASDRRAEADYCRTAGHPF